jgi:uncharacterized protein (DUF1330 family)
MKGYAIVCVNITDPERYQDLARIRRAASSADFVLVEGVG